MVVAERPMKHKISHGSSDLGIYRDIVQVTGLILCTGVQLIGPQSTDNILYFYILSRIIAARQQIVIDSWLHPSP